MKKFYPCIPYYKKKGGEINLWVLFCRKFWFLTWLFPGICLGKMQSAPKWGNDRAWYLSKPFFPCHQNAPKCQQTSWSRGAQKPETQQILGKVLCRAQPRSRGQLWHLCAARIIPGEVRECVLRAQECRKCHTDPTEKWKITPFCHLNTPGVDISKLNKLMAYCHSWVVYFCQPLWNRMSLIFSRKKNLWLFEKLPFSESFSHLKCNFLITVSFTIFFKNSLKTLFDFRAMNSWG